MAWGPGASPTAGGLGTSLSELFVFGPTDSSKNLVTGTTLVTSATGGSTGTDAIGTYFETAGNSTDRLLIEVNGTTSLADTDTTWMIVFSEIAGTVPGFATHFWQSRTDGTLVSALVRPGAAQLQFSNVNNAVFTTYDPESPAASTEHALVVTRVGTSFKLFATGGGSPHTATASAGWTTGNLGFLHIGNQPSGSNAFPARYRAYARWAGRALSDSDAQSLANTPQSILATGGGGGTAVRRTLTLLGV